MPSHARENIDQDLNRLFYIRANLIVTLFVHKLPRLYDVCPPFVFVFQSNSFPFVLEAVSGPRVLKEQEEEGKAKLQQEQSD